MPSSEVMHKWKSGDLHSGSKHGPKVTNQKQAVAIMLSEKRAEQKNHGVYPERAIGGPINPAMLPQMMGASPQGIANAAMPPQAGAMTPPVATAAANATPVPQQPMSTPASVAAMQKLASGGGATQEDYSDLPPEIADQLKRAETDPSYGVRLDQSLGVAPSIASPTLNVQQFGSTPHGSIDANGNVHGFERGGVANRAAGGPFGGQNIIKPPGPAPWFERQEARNLHVGPVLSNVPGRTDNHKVSVPAGSYVLPAAHVASMGAGNTNAGMSLASKMFGGPYGTAAPKMGGHGGMPRPPKPMTTFALGGSAHGDNEPNAPENHGHFEPVPVDISGGEYVIPPWEIMRRYGSLKNGHAVLDKWVMDTRKHEIKTQRSLPPPAKK